MLHEFPLWALLYIISFMKDKPKHILFLYRVTDIHSFDTYILKISREISQSQALEVHMNHGHATT